MYRGRERDTGAAGRRRGGEGPLIVDSVVITPSPPTKSARVELSGRLPIKFDGHENSHPLELRVCLSQTIRIPNS